MNGNIRRFIKGKSFLKTSANRFFGNGMNGNKNPSKKSDQNPTTNRFFGNGMNGNR
jgi:hypothetical protein